MEPSAQRLNILGIIPARKGSKRVPGKNTKLLGGIPLIEYALNACSGSRYLSKVVVSSDDHEVETIVKQYPLYTFVSRPPELATDVSPAIDYVHHTLKSVADKNWDIVVIVQPTTPFVLAEDIDATIALLIRTNAESSVSVVKLDQMHHPYKLKVMEDNVLLPFLQDEGNIKAAHELPEVYSRNGGVYATKVAVIQQGRILGDPCVGYVMPYERSIDINYPIDFEFAEFMAGKIHKARP